MLKKLKNDKKGFTLVELIVVLVILAILAALLVPALTGYIDKAKEKAIIAETRSVVMAGQTLADEEYANKPVGGDNAITLDKDKVLELADVNGNITSITVDKTGKVTEVKYSNKGKTCTYTGPTTSNDTTTGTVTKTDATYTVQ